MNEKNNKLSSEEMATELEKLSPEALAKIKSFIDAHQKLKRLAFFSCMCFVWHVWYMKCVKEVITTAEFLAINIVYCVCFCLLAYFDFEFVDNIKEKIKEKLWKKKS